MTTYADLVKQAMEYLKPVDPTLAADNVTPLRPQGLSRQDQIMQMLHRGLRDQYGTPPAPDNVVPIRPPIERTQAPGLPLAFFQQLASNNPDMLRGMMAQDPQAQAPPEPPPGNPPPIAPIPLGQKMFRERGRYPRGNPIPGLEENQIGPGVQP